MIIFKHSEEITAYLTELRKKNYTSGFVPTMGALHAGHLSLILESKKQDDITICSIFVNPVQFNNNEDFQKYPSTIEKDILLLEEHGCDILFMPSEKEMYPNPEAKNKHFELGYLEQVLEGKFRPGHFQGVCLIVEKLLRIINPGRLYLGQKDYQQCLVIKKLIGQMQQNTSVIICPVFREESGLAMSSRNLRLKENEKELASYLYKNLLHIKNHILSESFLNLKKEAIMNLEKRGFTLDYLELADSANLRILDKFEKSTSCIILIAAFLGDIRLIDNLLIKE